MRITLLPDDATEEKLRGVSKDTRSSDSSRKAFVRKVREIGVAANGQSPYRWLEKDANRP